MNATEKFLDTGDLMARIARVRVVGPNTLEIAWTEGARAGRTDVLDLAPLIGGYKVYRPLRRNPQLFATARLIENGGVVAWDGPDLEMTAELIETFAEQAMSPQDFARFLARNNLTHEAAAAHLGRSRRQIEYYLKQGPIPRVVTLACVGYEARGGGITAARSSDRR